VTHTYRELRHQMNEHGQDLARRLRTARHWAGLTRDELGEKLGVVGETIGRYERGEFKKDLEPRTIAAIADATGVPDWFLTDGFERPHEEPALVEAVEALQNQMTAVWQQLALILERDSETTARAAKAALPTDKGARGTGRPEEPQGDSRL
jgi:transcriptional regulator with XRE-family HTH domain